MKQCQHCGKPITDARGGTWYHKWCTPEARKSTGQALEPAPVSRPKPGWVWCLGPGAISRPHQFYSEDVRRVRICRRADSCK
jgi:hypothetical protein